MSTSPNIKLAALDLDGTLLNQSGLISPMNMRALRNWEASGRHVVICTGRPPRAVKHLASALHDNAVAICSNGALLYDFSTNTVTTRETLVDDVVVEIVKRLRNLLPLASFELEFGLKCARDVTFPEFGNPIDEIEVGDVLELITNPVAKLIIWDPSQSPAGLYELCDQAVAGRATVTRSGAPWVEISALGVDKAQALEEHCSQLGISASEVVAMGDGHNDLPMLQWAGTSVAMGNAEQEVIAAASQVTSSNEDDGVAEVLNKIRIAGL